MSHFTGVAHPFSPVFYLSRVDLFSHTTLENPAISCLNKVSRYADGIVLRVCFHRRTIFSKVFHSKYTGLIVRSKTAFKRFEAVFALIFQRISGVLEFGKNSLHDPLFSSGFAKE